MREKYLVKSKRGSITGILTKANIALQFDEARGEMMARSDLNHSDSLDRFLFGVLDLPHPRGQYSARSGVHLKQFYRYFLPCTRWGWRKILDTLAGHELAIEKTRKLWRK